MISDPGYRLVREARRGGAGCRHRSGCLRSDCRACDFRPAERPLSVLQVFCRSGTRRARICLAGLADVAASLVFYETAPRLERSLRAIGEIVDPPARWRSRVKLTKIHEECRSKQRPQTSPITMPPNPPKGEIVLTGRPACAKRSARGSIPMHLLRAATEPRFRQQGGRAGGQGDRA